MTISDHEIHSLAYLNWPHDKLARWLTREKGFTITERRIELAFNRAQKKTHRRPRGVRAGDLVTIRPEVQNEAPIAGRDHTSSYRQSTVDLGNALEKYWNKRLHRRIA